MSLFWQKTNRIRIKIPTGFSIYKFKLIYHAFNQKKATIQWLL
ncbi:hypothetical protein PCARR_a1322 [Pseudoalteromonas carrageenovora IAM 12662]|uniref:Uncharacterized protein n=1 Tax=Pseudoalteromonas carrageenovora IAM 12662 TaxID=1314868 RepID=A0ABR9EUT0_PSEVC|nr:hypothetical protein [Pseudoalteromonas carrageenovora IAM 12662]